ncbi:extracellular solute-binding protein [Paenibacillus oryzisoli]|uniref:extracellular solute-binding protein n=1 Tax=Paenibacillus oryzisoli TaxID=1850517 RepID=UPI003D2CB60E
MQWRKKSSLAALLTAMSVIAACSGNGAAPANSSGPSGAPSGKAAGNEAPVEIKIMANYTKPNQTESDKKFIEEIEKLNNVKLVFEVPPATGYSERLQLMLASGTYPDVVMFPGTSNQSFQNAVRDGIIIPVNEYIKNSENLQKYTYQASWDQLKINQDDKIYGIPRTSVVRNDAHFFRKDWLDHIGFKVPDNFEITLDEFAQILEKFTTGDPDGNGKNDTYGYGGAYNGNKVLDPIVPGAFNLTGWQTSAGGEYDYMNPIYDRNSNNFKKALEFSAKMYTSGYFDPDSATNDYNKQRERFVKGLTGVFPGFSGHYDRLINDLKKTTSAAELTYLFVKNEQGEVKGGSLEASSTGLWGFWGITSTAKNPQKIVDVLNSWISDEMWGKTAAGYEGLDYIVANGKKAPTDPPAVEAEFRKSTMRRANDISFFLTVSLTDEQRNKIVPWLEKSIKTVVPAKDNAFIPAAAKKPDYMDYTKTWQQTILQIIMGDKPISEFDKLLDGWYKNGGNDYVKQMNEYIVKMKSK